MIVGALVGMLLFAAATQGYWLTRSRLWESAALLLVTFTFFRPGYWWDMVYEPTRVVPATEITQFAEQLPPDGKLVMMVKGETIDGDVVEKAVQLPMGPAGSGEERLTNAGLETRVEDDGKVVADNVMFGSPAQQAGLDFDWQILDIRVEADRPPKQLMFIPATLLLALVAMLQLRRRKAGAG